MASTDLLTELINASVLAEADARAFTAKLAGVGVSIQGDQDLIARLVAAGHLTSFQGQQALKGKARALVIGEYVVLDRIGAGGMGKVYKARHRRMKRLVAIKIISSATLETPDGAKRFQREVEAAAKLNHPNIVTAYDAGEIRGQHYLVMEFVEGRDLSALVHERGPLPVAEALNYITQAARGLAYAHGEGVIHRDIKPANLLLDPKGVVKILDMGLARFDDPTSAVNEGLTQSGQVMGTVDYMAPEQAFDTHHADARSDIYSLGCSLYRLLFADHLYNGDSIMQKFIAHREAPIPDLRAKRSDISPELEQVFKRMVAKQPDERYRTMNHAVYALEKCLAEVAPSISVRRDENSVSTNDYRPPLATNDAAPDDNPASTENSVQTLSSHSADERTRPSTQVSAPRGENDSPTRLQSIVATNPPWWTTHRRLIGISAAGFLIVLLGVWIIIKDDKGKEVGRVKVDVPKGGQLEVRPDDAPLDEPIPEPDPNPTPVGPATANDRAAAEWVLSLGRSVKIAVPTTDGKFKTTDVTNIDDLPNVDVRLVAVHIEGTIAKAKTVQNDFERFRGLKNLTSFQLKNPITSEILTILQDSVDLTSLSLQPAVSEPRTFSDADAQKIAKWKKLGTLNIVNTSFTDEAVEYLTTMPKLHTLYIMHSKITNSGFRKLVIFKQVRRLHLSYALVDDDGTEVLAECSRLDTLVLDGNAISDASLMHIKKMQNIKWLSISETKCTDDGLKLIAEMPSLRTLSINRNPQLTDTGLEHLESMTALESLNLSVIREAPGITAAGIAKLQAALPNLKINK